jgi:dTDP-D-glucose 4,6-dehydratase
MVNGWLLLGALAGISVPLYGDGRQRREFTYVQHVAVATLVAADGCCGLTR